MTEYLRVAAWLPNKWGQYFTEREKTLIATSEIDLLLVPENHDQWVHWEQWKQVADELSIAIYAGFEEGTGYEASSMIRQRRLLSAILNTVQQEGLPLNETIGIRTD